MKELLHHLKTTLSHILPLTLLVLAVSLMMPLLGGERMGAADMKRFIIGSLFLLAGMSLIHRGEVMSLIPMGERIGAFLSGTKKYPLLIGCCFLMGALITAAEPDVAVFARQFPGVADRPMIYAMAAGVGAFLVIGVLRIIKRLSLPIAMAVIYALVFALAYAAPKGFFAVAFDAGAVATGPILTPFVMALGVGLAAVRGGRRAEEESFGTVALCAAGTTAAMLIFGMTRGAQTAEAQGSETLGGFLSALPFFLEEVALALAPIIVFFIIFQLVFLKLKKHALIRTGVGIFYSYAGHVLFLTGVSVGYLPAGEYLGGAIAGLGNYRILLIPVGMLMGFFTVLAEPAVREMTELVEELTSGAVTKKAMITALSIGVAFSVGLAMVRVLTGAPLIIFLAAGYVFAALLAVFAPRTFTAIAFDSGGVVTGALSLIFLLPFALGAAQTVGGSDESVLTDAFGLMAMTAIAPLITVQLMGLIYRIKLRKAARTAAEDPGVRIVEFGLEETEEL